MLIEWIRPHHTTPFLFLPSLLSSSVSLSPLMDHERCAALAARASRPRTRAPLSHFAFNTSHATNSLHYWITTSFLRLPPPSCLTYPPHAGGRENTRGRPWDSASATISVGDVNLFLKGRTRRCAGENKTKGGGRRNNRARRFAHARVAAYQKPQHTTLSPYLLGINNIIDNARR